MIAGIKIENGSCNPDYTLLRGGLSSESYDLIYFTGVQNLTIIALAVAEISLGPQKLKRVT